ncbi:phage terminase large subunit [bacterium]|nr:phage terminase large subunit [bacterium]
MIPDYVRQQARIELARRNLYDYCRLMNPQFYKEDRTYLKEMCDKIQEFVNQNEKKFLVINMPPRHGKSLTGKNTVEWLFGENPKLRVMTGSYNETLSGQFAKQVRDTIQTIKVDDKIVYNDIFPNTKVKYGEASASMWSLQGSNQKNYLATSPTGTATGFGANILIIDDLIKNDEEAYNENTLDKQWSWLNNTMLSRTEEDWKVIILMTRWATKDLAGRIIETFGDLVEVIKYRAVQEDGTMLCEEILSKEDFEIKTKEMNEDIVQANFNQEPIDIKGRLYGEFKEYTELPKTSQIYSYTDTADKGEDYLVTIVYTIVNNEVYVIDIQYDDRSMEITEEEAVDILYKNEVNIADVESNNGGRGWARNVERRLKEKYNSNKTVIRPFTQTGNKESRILASATWVNEHFYMPFNWKNKYREAYINISNFQKKGKNKHDDIEDVMAGIYEKVANKPRLEFGYRSII